LAKKYYLDKIIKQGVTYRTKPRLAYIIREVGTDSAGSARLKINGKDTGYFDSDVAPLHKKTTNLLGLLDLGEFYYVVPPETKLEFEGDSGSKCRIKGEIVELAVGESLEAAYAGRFSEQHRRFKTVYEGSFSLGTDEVWKNNVEHEILSLTPLTSEKITLNDIVMVLISGGTVNEGDFGVEIYLDNTPFEIDVAENAPRGIDVLSMPYPPKEDTEMLAFTLKDYPIEVLGDHTLSIRVRNVSGADKSPASGSAWSVKVKLVAVYERTGR